MSNSEKEDDGMQYSIGVLITLILIFWFTCKCINKNSREYDSDSDEHECRHKPRIPGSKTSSRYLHDETSNNKTLETHGDVDDKQARMHLSKKKERMHDIPRSNTVNFNNFQRSEVGY